MLLLPSPGDLPGPGIEPTSPMAPAGGFLMTEPPGKPREVKGLCIEPSEFSSWLQTYRWFFRPDHRQTRKLSLAGFMGMSMHCSL